MTSIKRVAYGYNSVLEAEGKEAYFLDALVCEDQEMLVDVHQTFKTKDEILTEMERILPLIGGFENA